MGGYKDGRDSSASRPLNDSNGERKRDFWFKLTRPLKCEGCGRELWAKGFYHKLTAKGRPGPAVWAPVGVYRGKPQNELVRTSVTFVPLDCGCGRSHTVRVLWLPRYFGARKSCPMDGYQIWTSETESEALDRVLTAITAPPPPPRAPGEVYNPMDEEGAARAKARIAETRARMGWK